jgi:hypothetical protein
MKLIRLDTIKNKINQFPIKASVFLRLKKQITLEEIDGVLFCLNVKLKDHVLDHDFCRDVYNVLLKVRLDNNYYFMQNSEAQYYTYSAPFTMSIEEYIKITSKSFYKGLVTKDQVKVLDYLLPDSIFNNIYTADGDLTFEINKECLYLFVRLMPYSESDLTGLIMFLNTDLVYMISERNNKEKCSSLGFIIKLKDRYLLKDFKYSPEDTWSPLNLNPHIRYKIKKQFINDKLFDNVSFKYSVEYSLLYINDNTLLDKYDLKVLDI